jgi:hypothetical protein
MRRVYATQTLEPSSHNLTCTLLIHLTPSLLPDGWDNSVRFNFGTDFVCLLNTNFMDLSISLYKPNDLFFSMVDIYFKKSRLIS